MFRCPNVRPAYVTTYPQESVFETTALHVVLEFPVDIVGQRFTLLGQLLNQGGVVLLYKLPTPASTSWGIDSSASDYVPG